MYNVIKRDGTYADFDINKISTAIKSAFDACQRQYNDSIIDFLALKVTADFEPKIKGGGGTRSGGLFRRCKGLHPLPPPERKAQKSQQNHA